MVKAINSPMRENHIMALGVLISIIFGCASTAIKSTAGASIKGIAQKSKWLVECDPLMNSVTKLCKTKVCILHEMLSAKINKNKKKAFSS